MNDYPTTLRFPRTMQQAFGPYTSARIDEDPPYDLWDRLTIGVSVVVSTGVVVLVALGVMA